MLRYPWRRSIAFQLWVRLSLALVVFAALVFPLYLWHQTADNIDQARDEASIRATVVGGALYNSGRRDTSAAGDARPAPGEGAPGEARRAGAPPPNTGGEEFEDVLVESFGLRALEQYDGDGNVVAAWGDASGGPVVELDPRVDLRLGPPTGREVAVAGGTYSEESINPFGLYQRREYGMVFYLGSTGSDGGGYRVVIDMSDLTDDAWALFYRSLVLGGALLVVALATLWVLLHYFVSRPLRAYSGTAHRIARGEALRMPDLGDNEIGELGAAINTMADALREQATVDALTGLYNVRHFKETLPGMLEEAAKKGEPLAIVNVDVDNLKPVNDSHGHAAGDLVLKTVGSCLRDRGGERAVHWRVGGDEFLVALPGADAARAGEEVARIEAAIASQQLSVRGETIGLSVSVGVAVFPEDADSMAALVAVSDERMYERKARSRDAA